MEPQIEGRATGVSEGPCAIVLLVHGTFAYRDHVPAAEATSGARDGVVWWERDSAFCSELDRLLDGVAACWHPKAINALPWSRPRRWAGAALRRFHGRPTFAWSGANSDRARRDAAGRLYEGLMQLEEAKVPYHFVGHSHGGTVIWHALQEAATRGHPLEFLRSWTTLGTPFPTYRAIRWRWLVAAAGFLLIGFVVFEVLPTRIGFHQRSMAVRVQDVAPYRDPILAILRYPGGFSPLTLIGLGLLALMILWCGHGFVMWFVRTFQARRERSASRAAWERHGSTWLGLFSPLDEALSGTQSTVGFYVPKLVRLPLAGWPPLPPDTWLGWLFYAPRLLGWCVGSIYALIFVPIFNGVLMPLAEWVVSVVLRLRFQGADRLGTRLAAMSPEPIRHAPARGPLPPSLAEPLDRLVAVEAPRTIFAVRDRLAGEARGPRPPREMVKELFRDLRPGREVIHNAYYEVPEIRAVIADHILTQTEARGDHPRAGDVRGASASGLPGEARAWLDVAPGPALDHPSADLPEYLPRPKPAESTPIWTRVLLGGAFLTLLVLAVLGLGNDVPNRLVPYLIEEYSLARAGGPDAQPRLEAVRQTLLVLKPIAETRVAGRVGAISTESILAQIELLVELDRAVPLERETVQTLGRLAHDLRFDIQSRIAARRALLDPKLKADPTPAFSDALNSKDDGARWSALAALSLLAARRPAAVAELLRAAGDRTMPVELRTRALAALGGTPANAVGVADVLIAALDDPSGDVFAAAAAALGHLGDVDGRVVPALLSHWKRNDDPKKGPAPAAEALLQLGTPAVAALNSDEVLRKYRISGKFVTEFDRRIDAGRLDDEVGREAVRRLIGVFESARRVERYQVVGHAPISRRTLAPEGQEAVRALGNLGRAHVAIVIPVLKNAVAARRSQDDRLPISEVKALGQIGPAAADAVGPLTEELRVLNREFPDWPDDKTRYGMLDGDAFEDSAWHQIYGVKISYIDALCISLGEIGPGSGGAVPTLIETMALAETNRNLALKNSRNIALKALESITCTPAVWEQLLPMLGEPGSRSRGDSDELVKNRRIAAIEVIGRIGERHWGNIAPGVDTASVQLEGSLIPDAVPFLIDALDPKNDAGLRYNAAESLSWIGLDLGDARRSAKRLQQLMVGRREVVGEKWIVEFVALAHGSLGLQGKAAVPILKPWTEDNRQSETSTDRAVLALLRIHPAEAANVLPAVLKRKDFAPKPGSRQGVLPVLPLLARIASVQGLRAVLKSKDVTTQCHAAFVLGLMGLRAGEAADDLRALLESDLAPLLRLEAARALSRVDPGAHEPAGVLVKLLADQGVGRRAAEALPELAGRAVSPLRETLTGQVTLRSLAAWALGQIGSQAWEAVPELLDVVQIDPPSRAYAFNAVTSIGAGPLTP